MNNYPPGKWKQSYYRILAGRLDSMGLSSSLRFSLQIMFKELASLKQLRKEILKQLNVLATSERYQETVTILESTPGIGLLTAIRLALEWGDVSRFKRKEDFASFTGLIPSEYSSGEQEHLGHITKQGPRGPRGWLIECCWIAIRKDPVLLDKFQRVYRNCGSKKKAIVAVARKLAIRLRALLLTKQCYELGLIE